MNLVYQTLIILQLVVNHTCTLELDSLGTIDCKIAWKQKPQNYNNNIINKLIN